MKTPDDKTRKGFVLIKENPKEVQEEKQRNEEAAQAKKSLRRIICVIDIIAVILLLCAVFKDSREYIYAFSSQLILSIVVYCNFVLELKVWSIIDVKYQHTKGINMRTPVYSNGFKNASVVLVLGYLVIIGFGVYAFWEKYWIAKEITDFHLILMGVMLWGYWFVKMILMKDEPDVYEEMVGGNVIVGIFLCIGTAMWGGYLPNALFYIPIVLLVGFVMALPLFLGRMVHSVVLEAAISRFKRNFENLNVWYEEAEIESKRKAWYIGGIVLTCVVAGCLLGVLFFQDRIYRQQPASLTDKSKVAQEYEMIADDMMSQEEFFSAIKPLSQAVSYEKRASCYKKLSLCYQRGFMSYEKAMESAMRALVVGFMPYDIDFPIPETGYGNSILSCMQHFKNGIGFELHEEGYLRWLLQYEESSEVYQQLGAFYMEQKDFLPALSAYSNALKLMPKYDSELYIRSREEYLQKIDECADKLYKQGGNR